MITFVKLGGSLITDKRVEAAFRHDVMARLAAEIRSARIQRPEFQLLLGHGSGSFGHFAAQKHGTIHGVRSLEEWIGFAEVAAAAATLNGLVAQTLRDSGVPVWRIQPSASCQSVDGVLKEMALRPIEQALTHSLVPLIYGDVSLDEARGGTILSTEMLFFFLAHHFPVSQILLLGEVEGVLNTDGKLISRITPKTLPQVEKALTGSAGIDVTGGMVSKVTEMVRLAEKFPRLQIRIFDGSVPGLLEQTLLNKAQPGTLIAAGD